MWAAPRVPTFSRAEVVVSFSRSKHIYSVWPPRAYSIYEPDTPLVSGEDSVRVCGRAWGITNSCIFDHPHPNRKLSSSPPCMSGGVAPIKGGSGQPTPSVDLHRRSLAQRPPLHASSGRPSTGLFLHLPSRRTAAPLTSSKRLRRNRRHPRISTAHLSPTCPNSLSVGNSEPLLPHMSAVATGLFHCIPFLPVKIFIPDASPPGRLP